MDKTSKDELYSISGETYEWDKDYPELFSGAEQLLHSKSLLNKRSVTSFEDHNLGPCMNPNGYVSNINCPVDDPYCNCPKKYLQPRDPMSGATLIEPTELELIFAKIYTSECVKINKNLSMRWFGIDYSDPKCAYNCIPDHFVSQNKIAKETGITTWRTNDVNIPVSDSTLAFPYSARKLYKDSQDKLTLAYMNPWDTTPLRGGDTYYNTPIGPTASTKASRTIADKKDAIPVISSFIGTTGSVGANFKDYLAYSKTNATFWNTPTKTPLYRKAQTALLTYQRVKILVNGDFSLKPGHTVGLNIPTGEMYKVSSLRETRFHGKWMIYKIDHNITPGKHSMVVYLMRDGNYQDPDKPVSNVVTKIDIS